MCVCVWVSASHRIHSLPFLLATALSVHTHTHVHLSNHLQGPEILSAILPTIMPMMRSFLRWLELTLTLTLTLTLALLSFRIWIRIGFGFWFGFAEIGISIRMSKQHLQPVVSVDFSGFVSLQRLHLFSSHLISDLWWLHRKKTKTSRWSTTTKKEREKKETTPLFARM